MVKISKNTGTSEPMIRLKGIRKDFKLRHEKSIKEVLISLASRRSEANNRFHALTNVNISIAQGESVGLVGHNGSGKSTLLKIIGGILSPTEGEVWRRGKLAALLELGAGFHPDLTGRENVYLNASILGMSRAETAKLIPEIIAFSDIPEEFIDSQVKFYSSGMYVRLAFAVAVHSDPDILLIDEVLAVGDEPFQHKCLLKIREFQEQGKTIVFVSHSPQQVKDVCNRVIVLSHGDVIFDGDAQEGLDELHKGYAEKELQSSTSDSSSDKENVVLIENVKLHSTKGKKSINFGDELQIDVDIEVCQENKFDLVVDLLGPSREVLYRTSIHKLGIKVPTKVGFHKINFLIKNINIGTSSVGCRAIATGTQGVWLSSLDSKDRLNITADKRGHGLFQFEVTAQTSK